MPKHVRLLLAIAGAVALIMGFSFPGALASEVDLEALELRMLAAEKLKSRDEADVNLLQEQLLEIKEKIRENRCFHKIAGGSRLSKECNDLLANLNLKSIILESEKRALEEARTAYNLHKENYLQALGHHIAIQAILSASEDPNAAEKVRRATRLRRQAAERRRRIHRMRAAQRRRAAQRMRAAQRRRALERKRALQHRKRRALEARRAANRRWHAQRRRRDRARRERLRRKHRANSLNRAISGAADRLKRQQGIATGGRSIIQNR